ncbi:DUF1697 domain-containing protein [Actinokineospora iranica]|uniref:Uncharacterized conserved protein, DUF1697 family n=1 Tax=Actinokineospora iranica TaxID=1271860 RepID=A0A1G6PDR7_9PSEU|nr:DUF1697 domain-containing protein [Actinokineospora iranica]SDC78141.1 Uncharacterized conserved protein, DUF1697 family [Actinokineospora iranica]
MNAYAALLRGVNVGGRTRIAMADLRSLLTTLGYTDVRTVLQSGNAVFTAPETDPATLESTIEEALAAELGLTTRCLIRTGPELQTVLTAHPLADVADNGSKMLAVFLSATPDPALAAEHDPVALDPDTIRIGDRVVYQWCPAGIAEAPALVPFLERKWRITATARNWNTVTKLAALT